jgi:hypothetical protein
MFKISILILVTCCLNFIHVASAEDTVLWKNIENSWSIYVDTTLGNGCFAVTVYDSGTVLRVGIDKTEGGVYAILGNQNWKSLEKGKKYYVKTYFGNKSPWEGNAQAIDMSGMNFLTVSMKSKENSVLFLKEFMEESAVRFTYNETVIANLKLTGSYKAGSEILECQKVMDAPNLNKDPFKTKEKGKADPFL